MTYEIIQIEKICRTCLSKEINMRPLFDIDELIGVTTRLSEMLISCASVQVMENDGLPSQVCLQCVHNITNAFSFKKLCERSENTLRELLNRPVEDIFLEQKPLLENDVTEMSSTITKTLDSEKEILIKMIVESDACDSDSKAVAADDLDIKEYKEEIEVEYNEVEDETFEVLVQNSTDCDGCQVAELKVEDKYEMEFKKEALEDETAQPIYPCDKCTSVFTVETDLKDHLKIHHKVLHHICKTCNRSFASANSLSDHKRIHIAKRHLCSVCGKGFARSDGYKRHMCRHTGEKPFQCKLCGKSFAESCKLLEHQRSHENRKNFICTVCDKAFSRRDSLAIHKKTHSKKTLEAHECVVCGKRLRGSMALHMRIHMDLREHMCPYCDKDFTTRAYLIAHKRKSHMEAQDWPYVCNTCGKGYRSSSRLASHSLTTCRKKILVCNTCGCSKANSYELTRHMRTHTGEKPYQCNLCPRAFARSDELRVHFKMHTGERNHVCSVCKKGFSIASRLKAHLRIHTREKS